MKTTCSTECCPNEAAEAQPCDGPVKWLSDADCNCPVEGATEMWAKAFGNAMGEAKTEILKSKILKAWGPMMEQVADAMMETMGAVWAEKVAHLRVAEAKSAFQDRMRNLWLEEKK